MNKTKKDKIIRNKIKISFLTIEGGVLDSGEVDAIETINVSNGYRAIELLKPIHGVATFWSSELGTVRLGTYFQRKEKYNQVTALDKLMSFQEERKRINHISYITAEKRYNRNIEMLKEYIKEENTHNESDI